MRKITITLLCLLIFALTASGCGSNKPEPIPSDIEDTTSQESGPVAPEKPTASQAAAHNAAIKTENVHIIQFNDPDPGDKLAVISTIEGDIKIRLFEKQVPETVKAFVNLVNEGYYNGQRFDTVIEGYKIEGGGKHGDEKYPEEKEFSLDLWNFRGAVALAETGTDFMIINANVMLNKISELEELNFPQPVIDKYDEIGGAPHQDWENTVFGQVIEGMDVVDKIASVKINDDGTPGEPIVITSISIDVAA